LEDLGFDRATVLSRLRYLTPEYSFRAGYAYTNFGLTEAALAAAKATGKSWEDLSAERLYRPLGMRSTSSRYADYLAAENHAVLHVRRDGQWTASSRNPDAQTPAGGVSSSVRDLAQWLRLHLNGGNVDGRQIVSADAMNDAHQPEVIAVQPPDSASGFARLYGLGWNVGDDGFGRVRLSHSGAFALGAATTVAVMPGDGLGMAVLSNGEPIGVPEAIAAAFFDLVNTGKVSRDWVPFLGAAFAAELAPKYGQEFAGPPPVSPAPAKPAAAYAGVYRNDYLGEVEVAPAGSDLVMRMGPLRSPFVLRHWDGDVFTFIPPGENGGTTTGATFTFGPGVASLVLENFEHEGAPPLLRMQ
jgi:CubicO group peptidase (beta-lactamase class C family)